MSKLATELGTTVEQVAVVGHVDEEDSLASLLLAAESSLVDAPLSSEPHSEDEDDAEMLGRCWEAWSLSADFCLCTPSWSRRMVSARRRASRERSLEAPRFIVSVLEAQEDGAVEKVEADV